MIEVVELLRVQSKLLEQLMKGDPTLRIDSVVPSPSVYVEPNPAYQTQPTKELSKLELCILHLTKYPEDVKLSGRDLAKLRGIASYVVWNEAKKTLKD